MEDIDKLKKRLVSLFAQFEKQDNPVVLREISMTAYKLMIREKEDLICCPECKEIGLIDNCHLPNNDSMRVFNNTSTMKCENGHHWKHCWAIGDKLVVYEPIEQYYVYRCSAIKTAYHVEFVRVNGARFFADLKWNNKTLEYGRH